MPKQLERSIQILDAELNKVEGLLQMSRRRILSLQEQYGLAVSQGDQREIRRRGVEIEREERNRDELLEKINDLRTELDEVNDLQKDQQRSYLRAWWRSLSQNDKDAFLREVQEEESA